MIADRFAHFFVAMLPANLVDRLLAAFKDHQLSRCPIDAPAGVVGVDGFLGGAVGAQLLVLLSDRPLTCRQPERRLSDRALRQGEAG